MGLSKKDLMAKTSSPEKVHKVCLNGALRSEHEQLSKELDELSGGQAKMGPSERERELAQQIQALEAKMEADTATFRFRGLSHWRLKEIQLRFPNNDPLTGDPQKDAARPAWDTSAGGPTLIAESLVDPKLTEDEVREWLEQGNSRLADELFMAAWIASHLETSVPKSERASALTGGTGSK